ncbi:MAG: quinone oxidoreductase [Burkholderiaceae bacterium]|nr:quinone oxidoreductase [Burkholderiaceae bacterium]
MRAIRIEHYGGPEVLAETEIAVPAPGPGEVLVKVAYAGVNFMDVYTRRGVYARPGHYAASLPLTLGMEGAGRIEAIGEGVETWKSGDRVSWCLVRGSYAEYAVVPESKLVAVPDGLGLDVAAATLFQGITAHYLVEDVGRLQHDRWCLVHAGSGGIGQLLIQMARRRGARVIATASSAQKAAAARDCGAEAVSSYESESLLPLVEELTGKQGVHVVFDSIGAATFETSLRALRRTGLMVLYGTNSGKVPPIDPMQLADGGSLFFTRPRLADYVPDAQTLRRRAKKVFDDVASGALSARISDVHEFSTLAEAHRRLEERVSIGKSVLRVAG